MKSDEPPTIRLNDGVLRSRILANCGPETRALVIGGGRMEKLLTRLQGEPSVARTTDGEELLFSLRSLLYGWVNQLTGEDFATRLIRWEIIPVIYDGTVNIRVRNGRIDINGDIFTGFLGYWETRGDGNGICTLLERPNDWIRFNPKDLAGDTEGKLIHLEGWDTAPWRIARNLQRPQWRPGCFSRASDLS